MNGASPTTVRTAHLLAAQRARVTEAQRLRAQGLSYQKAGEILSVDWVTVWRWCRPGYDPCRISRKTPFWDRMAPRLVVPALGPCLEYLGGRTPLGYGMVTVDGKKVYAHRHAYELTNGPLAPGALVCHRCDNPACCKPEHLYAGTASDNARDRSKSPGSR